VLDEVDALQRAVASRRTAQEGACGPSALRQLEGRGQGLAEPLDLDAHRPREDRAHAVAARPAGARRLAVQPDVEAVHAAARRGEHDRGRLLPLQLERVYQST